MSESIAGAPAAPPPAPVKLASAVVLFRRTERGPEVFWLRREKTLRFAGGFYAFPGGRLDASDANVKVEGASGLDAQLIVTAARELFEETGVLMARGSVWQQDRRDAARRALLEETRSFHDLLVDARASLHAADFPSAGRWITPPFMPMGRFDARFFLVESPAQQHAEVWPGELAAGEWIRPSDALSQWEAGTALLHPPNLHAVQVMSRFSSVDVALKELLSPPLVTDFVAKRLEFQRGVVLAPVKTPTLPPATHTNGYLLGTRSMVWVDPGSPDDAETDSVIELVRALEKEGRQLEAVLLTHHHGDHTGGVRRVMSVLKVPVWAHALTAERVEFPVSRLLQDGEVLTLAGAPPMKWRVLHTPGHARGHVCLIDEASKALIAGDMVSTLSTIVIDPPEGDMAAYLSQLERLRAEHITTLYPAHGPAAPNGNDKLEEYVVHRAWRQQKVLDALRSFDTPVSLEALVPRAYDDVAEFVLPIAERNTLAILNKLVAEGAAELTASGYRPRA